jgi:dTDP-4-dehydrorhamnose reductase
MRILVTGSGGQLGSDLCRMLANETVIPKDLPEFDLTQPAIEAQIQEARPDVVVHAGAYTDVDGAERATDLAMAVNRDGAARVARAAARSGARLIYVSTDYVFDGTAMVPCCSDSLALRTPREEFREVDHERGPARAWITGRERPARLSDFHRRSGFCDHCAHGEECERGDSHHESG